MTTGEASKRFEKSKREIRELCRQKLVLNAHKISGKWNIPDDTDVILSIEEIKSLLLKILLLKNNPYEVISWGNVENKKEIIFDYLYNIEYIGDYKNIAPDKLLYNIQLTRKGFDLVLGENEMRKALFSFSLNFKIPIQIGIGNVCR